MPPGDASSYLGAPGAGKTTLLVELALDLLARVRTDATRPLPVIFDLSHWSSEDTLLGYCVIDELVQSYHVPRRLAYSFVAKVEVVPLIDGLDELDEAKRAAVYGDQLLCLVHGQLPMSCAVSERRVYLADVVINPSNHVAIQNLTDEQILVSRARRGEHGSATRAGQGGSRFA